MLTPTVTTGIFTHHPVPGWHPFTYERIAFRHGVEVHRETVTAYCLDRRDPANLVVGWNRRPQSALTGMGYVYTLL